MKPLASLLFIAVITLGVSSRCPPNWIEFQGNCYRYGNKALNWIEAQVMCLTRDAKLAEVLSSQENDFLRSIAKEKQAHCVWFGGDDIFHKFDWEWSNTSNTFNGFTNWSTSPRQPDNSGGEQDCLDMFSDYNYDWDDASCTTACNFICSRPASV